jgi:hypothetical protein
MTKLFGLLQRCYSVTERFYPKCTLLDWSRRVVSMKWQSILAGALASVFGTLFIAGTASADVRIVNDPGGAVSSYLRAFHEMRATGERIVIDGPCLSACTLLTGIVPRDHVCVLLQRRIALAGADAGRHAISDAALPPRNPRLDRPPWRAHAAAYDDARPGSGGALPALSQTCHRPRARTYSHSVLDRNSSGSLAMFTAIIRASSLLSNVAAVVSKLGDG